MSSTDPANAILRVAFMDGDPAALIAAGDPGMPDVDWIEIGTDELTKLMDLSMNP